MNKIKYGVNTLNNVSKFIFQHIIEVKIEEDTIEYKQDSVFDFSIFIIFNQGHSMIVKQWRNFIILFDHLPHIHGIRYVSSFIAQILLLSPLKTCGVITEKHDSMIEKLA